MLVAQPGQDPGCGMALLAWRGQVIGEHLVDRRLVRVQARCCADRFLAGWGFRCGECLADCGGGLRVCGRARGWTGHRLARRGGCRCTAALVIPSWLPCPRDWFPVMGTSLKGWGQFRPSHPGKSHAGPDQAVTTGPNQAVTTTPACQMSSNGRELGVHADRLRARG